MRRKPTLLVANMGALAVAIAALGAACLYVMLPTIGGAWTWTDILTLVSSSPACWLLIGGVLTGCMAAALQKPRDFTAHTIAGLCLAAGVGLGLYAWLPAEIMFPGVVRDGDSLSDARIAFMAPNYVVALSYLVLGLAGSAAVLAVLRIRGDPPRW